MFGLDGGRHGRGSNSEVGSRKDEKPKVESGKPGALVASFAASVGRRVRAVHLGPSLTLRVTIFWSVARLCFGLLLLDGFLDGGADGPLFSVAVDVSVEGVSFDGCSAGFLDEGVELIDGGAFGGFCAGVVVDGFVDDGAVEVVGAVGEGELCGLLSEHDPVGFDVVEVVEIGRAHV